jgi:flavin reductase (DIM6/NTAB) family NADH-FMN oxidoreductase RutF
MKAPSDHLKNTVGRALGRVPSGVFILTAVSDGRSPSDAVMVSWVQQAGFDPPAITVAISRQRHVIPAIRGDGRFALSIVSQDDTSLMKRFARGVPDGADPFEGVATRRSPGGLTVLVNALGFLECRLLHVCDFGGDHELFVGEVVAGEVFRDGHAFAHQRGNGFHY